MYYILYYCPVCSGKRPFEVLEVPGQLAEAGKAVMITNILLGTYLRVYFMQCSAGCQLSSVNVVNIIPVSAWLQTLSIPLSL